MKLSEPLVLKLRRRYEPSSMVDMRFKGKDMTFKTDNDGNPVILFIGKKQSDGKIKGERYTRTLVRDAQGGFIKDHWDLKGKT